MANNCTHLLIVDDDVGVALALRKALSSHGYNVTVASSGGEALSILKSTNCHLVISDVRMPEMDGLMLIGELHRISPLLPVILVTAHGSTDIAIKATKHGAFDYICKPFEIRTLLNLIESALPRAIDAEERSISKFQINLEDEIIGDGPAMRTIFKEIGRLAPRNISVLIRGETGTGKELIAHALHQYSDRSEKPFIAVNCLAIPENLLESELFGHERGAFTGAASLRKGRFEQADGGTLFLDEIGDITPTVQGKLLRVLQEKCIYRVGGAQSISVDVRIVSATNRDLTQAIALKNFREDLYFRLAGSTIFLPPLRDRKEDIPKLAEFCLRRFRRELGCMHICLAPSAFEALQAHPWPGNVRELESVIRRALILCRGQNIDFEIIKSSIDYAVTSTEKEVFSFAHLATTLLDSAEFDEKDSVYSDFVTSLEKELFRQAMQRSKGNQSRISKWLGISRPTVLQKLRQYSLLDHT